MHPLDFNRIGDYAPVANFNEYINMNRTYYEFLTQSSTTNVELRSAGGSSTSMNSRSKAALTAGIVIGCVGGIAMAAGILLTVLNRKKLQGVLGKEQAAPVTVNAYTAVA